MTQRESASRATPSGIPRAVGMGREGIGREEARRTDVVADEAARQAEEWGTPWESFAVRLSTGGGAEGRGVADKFWCEGSVDPKPMPSRR